MERIVVKRARRVDHLQVIRLYKEAGWWKDTYAKTPAAINAIVRGSYCFVGAFCHGELIGMGRCLSDGVGDAYIQDVTVLTSFRNRGVGELIVTAIVEYLRRRGIDWIVLIAGPGAKRFYNSMGFKTLVRFTPMVWGQDE